LQRNNARANRTKLQALFKKVQTLAVEGKGYRNFENNLFARCADSKCCVMFYLKNIENPTIYVGFFFISSILAVKFLAHLLDK